MNRRKFLLTADGAIISVSGGAAVANATRADILATSELTRGKGEAVAIENTITRDSVDIWLPKVLSGKTATSSHS